MPKVYYNEIKEDMPLVGAIGSADTILSPKIVGKSSLIASVTGEHLQSEGFVSGSTGWQLTAAGSIEANTGTFRGDLSGSTITGGTIQTDVSPNKRIEVTNADGIRIYNTDGILIGQLQTTDAGTLFSSTSPNTASRMFQQISFIQSGSNANPMVYLEAADVSTGTNLLELQQRGDLEAIKITNYNTSAGNAINVLYSGSATEAVKIVNDTASVKGLYVSNTYVNSNAYVAEFINAGASAGVGAVYVEGRVAAIGALQVKQNTETVANSNNYYKTSSFNGGGITKSIWISDGNNPNTDGLAGAIGDICLNCGGGQAFYNNNGSTGWTGM